jgi:hypothetical protein
MKEGATGMSLDELLPAAILQRFDAMTMTISRLGLDNRGCFFRLAQALNYRCCGQGILSSATNE